jgi:beta-lactamase class A
MKRNMMLYGILALILLVGGTLTSFAAISPAKPAAVPPSVVTKSSSSATSTLSLSENECPMSGKFFGAVGIYAKNLKTGQVLALNPDDIFAAASTIKVPVSIIVYRHFYSQADPALRAVYDTGVELMMTVSDNDYFADFLDEIEENIGAELIREHFSRLGMKNTSIRDSHARKSFGYSNVTTAKDMAIIFEQLYLGKLISPEKTDFMLESMAHSIFPEEMPRYMQQRKVIHKIGELDDVLADVGVIESPNGPILISIFTETPQDGDYASDYIAAMSACLYSRLSGGEQTAWVR